MAKKLPIFMPSLAGQGKQEDATCAAMSKKIRLALLGSGRGSNAKSILEAMDRGEMAAEAVLIASDHAGAGILELARTHDVPTYLIEEPKYRTRLSPEVEQALADRLLAVRADLIVLAGYLRVVKEPLLSAFPRRILNIHPSLLPLFPGLAAWQQALDAGVPETGCTVHWVDAGVDTGPILGQERVPVLPGDTAESLHARIQEAEHRLYPSILQSLCRDLSAPLP
jgi:phosphoribosylglycinamide formyltransferase-1